MGDKNAARRAEVRIAISGFPVMQLQINKYLSALTYIDNEEDAADDLQITMDDRDGLWLKKWLGKDRVKQSRIDAVIVQKNWISNGRDKVLDCGSFEIDTINASGPPSQITLKAASLPNNQMREQLKSKVWENITLSAIARKIGNANETHVLFESSFNPKYKRRVQSRISDIAFLQKLCKKAGVSLKVTGSYLVLFDAAKYESMDAVRVIKKGSADVLSWQFSSATVDVTYKKCVVTYTDPETGDVFEGSFTLTEEVLDPAKAEELAQARKIKQELALRIEETRKQMLLQNKRVPQNKGAALTVVQLRKLAKMQEQASVTIAKLITQEEAMILRDVEEGQVLEVNEKVASNEEAKTLAQKKMREKNKNENKVDFTLVGDVNMVGGVTAEVIGWGTFDGKYIVETATHNIATGYTVNVTLRRVLKGY